MPKKPVMKGRPIMGDEKLLPHSVCLPKSLSDKAKEIDGRPLSAIVRELLGNYVKRHQKRKSS